MTIEYKICFQGERLEGWSLVNDAALPSVGSVICLDGDYWHVNDIVHYPVHVTAPSNRDLTPHVLVTKVSSPTAPIQSKGDRRT